MATNSNSTPSGRVIIAKILQNSPFESLSMIAWSPGAVNRLKSAAGGGSKPIVAHSVA